MKKEHFLKMSVPKVRAVFSALCQDGKPCHVSEIIQTFDLSSKKEKDKIYDSLRFMKKTGEAKSLGNGQWLYIGRQVTEAKRLIMWRILRSRKMVTISDLQELAGASDQYAEEWLRGLIHKGIVVKSGKQYRLIKDTVVMPKDRSNAEKLRRIRSRQRLKSHIEETQDLLKINLTDTIKIDIANKVLDKVLLFLQEDLKGC